MRVSKVLHCMQTLYAHSRAVQQGVAYYAHPWDDGVTLLHRPAAGCPVIVDGGYTQNVYPCVNGRYELSSKRYDILSAHLQKQSGCLLNTSLQNVYPRVCNVASAFPTQSVLGVFTLWTPRNKRWYVQRLPSTIWRVKIQQ